MQERRRHDRSRAFEAGTIADRERRATLHCVVRNLSSGGALLLVDEPSRAPSELDLIVYPGGGPRRARVVWRGEAAVGVVFAPPPAAPAAAISATAPRPSASVVSLAEVRRARAPTSDEGRLAERIAAIARPSSRPRPDWAWPRPSR